MSLFAAIMLLIPAAVFLKLGIDTITGRAPLAAQRRLKPPRIRRALTNEPKP